MKYAALCSIALAVQLLGFHHVLAAGGSSGGDGECSFQTAIKGGSGDPKLEQMNQFTIDDGGTQETTNFG